MNVKKHRAFPGVRHTGRHQPATPKLPVLETMFCSHSYSAQGRSDFTYVDSFAFAEKIFRSDQMMNIKHPFIEGKSLWRNEMFYTDGFTSLKIVWNTFISGSMEKF